MLSTEAINCYLLKMSTFLAIECKWTYKTHESPVAALGLFNTQHGVSSLSDLNPEPACTQNT